MTEIQPTRLNAIFKTLSATSKKTEQAQRKVAAKPHEKPAATQVRSKEDLSNRLRGRLKKLSKDSESFTKDATLIAIQEIIIWEFGDDILDHPEFKLIARSITEKIKESKELQVHMSKLINEFID